MRLAETIQVAVCDDPHCRCVHIIMAEGGCGDFAMAAIPLAEIPDFIESLKNGAYAIAAGKGD